MNDTQNVEKPWLFTKDSAAEAGRKGGKASGRARSGQPSLEDLRKKGPKVLKDLLDAAEGRGAWSKLDPKDRLSALKAALPYVLGRPGPMNPQVEEEEEDKPSGFVVSERSDGGD